MFERYDDIVSVEDLSEMLMVGRNGIYKLLGSGEIKAFRYGHRTWKIPKQSVEEYVLRKSGFIKIR